MSAECFMTVAFLVALAWPAARAASSRAYWRVFPIDTSRIAGLVLIYLAGIGVVAWFEPNWLRLPAIAAAVTGAIVLWRARPGFGAAAGLPIGSLWPLPVGPWSDPEFYRQQFARHGAVFKTSQFGQPMVCTLGLGLANRLLREHDSELVAPPHPLSRFIEGGYLRYLPDESHGRYRRFFGMLFHSDVAAAAEPRVALAFRQGLTAMAQASAERGSARVTPHVKSMMFAAWADLFYGINATEADFARLKACGRVIDIRKARWASRRRVEGALREIEGILTRRVAAFTLDQISAPQCFLAALVKSDPRALDDRAIFGNLVYISQVSWGDVSGLLVWIFKKLSDHPTWRDRLADQPSRDLATRVVQETLRLEQSESRYRRAVTDIDVEGCRIPRGWLVRMCVRESHQDEQTFPNPGRFDPDRFAGRTFTANEYGPFGAYRLACIGEEITKTVGATFALELTSGFDWRVLDDGPPAIGNWAHNAPSPRLAVHMTRRRGRVPPA